MDGNLYDRFSALDPCCLRFLLVIISAIMSLTTLKLMYEKGTGTDVSLTVKGDNRCVRIK